MHNSKTGYVLVKIKHTERWLLMTPPIPAIDDEWIEEIGPHFKIWRMAEMEKRKLNELSECK
jgi:hypothetical protein